MVLYDKGMLYCTVYCSVEYNAGVHMYCTEQYTLAVGQKYTKRYNDCTSVLYCTAYCACHVYTCTTVVSPL